MHDDFSPEWGTSYRDVSTLEEILPCVAKMEGILGEERGDETHGLGPLLLIAARHSTKVEALCLEPKGDDEVEERCCTRLVIPLSYPGWWQVIPEKPLDHDCQNSSGGAPEAWQTVQEAAQALPSELLALTDLQAHCLLQPQKRGPQVYSKTTIPAGEILSILGTTREAVEMSKKPSCYSFIKRKVLKSKKGLEEDYLMCKDCVGRDLLVSLEQQGEFYPVGSKVDEPTGNSVYQIKDLVNNASSLTLKLVKGEPPSTDDSNFTGIISIDQVYSEEAIIGSTIFQEKPMLVEFPLDSEIQFSVAENLKDLEDTTSVQGAIDYYDKNAEAYSKSIKTLQNISNPKQGEQIERCATPTSPRLKPKGSFLMRNRELPPLPEKLSFRRKSAWELLKEKRKSLLSLLPTAASKSETEQDPNYEKIPYYQRQRSHKLSVGTISTCDTISECNTKYEETPTLPRKSIGMYPRDEDGYLLPAEAQEQLQEYRRQLSRERNVTGADAIEEPVYSNQSNLNISSFEEEELDTCMDAIVFSGNLKNEDIPVIDSERMDSFLMDTMQELERKLHSNKHEDCFSNNKSEIKSEQLLDQLETQEAVDDYLNLIFSACDVLSEDDTVFYSPGKRMPDIGIHRSLSLDTGSIHNTFPDSHSEPFGHFHSVHHGVTSDSGIYLSHMNSGLQLSETDNESLNFYRSFSECSWYPPDDISGMSVEEVAMSLKYIGLRERMVTRFCEEQMDGKQICDITEDVMKEAFPELNILERKKILDFVQGWRPKRWT